jgi:solute carrier family 25 protein 16
MIPYAGTSFLIWGFLRGIFIPEPPPSASPSITSSSPSGTDARPKPLKSKPHPVADLLIGAVAGATAQTVSYPFEVIRRRQQVGGVMRPSHWLGFRETTRDVWARGGWRGFFVGLSIGYLKVVPMTAVSFASWEWGKRILGI